MLNSIQSSTDVMKMLGILLIVLGVLSMAAPVIAGSALVIVIGLFLLLAGIMHMMQGYQALTKEDKWVGLVLGLIETLFGLLVIIHPLFGLGFLTILLVIYFVIEGIWKIIMATLYRAVPGWSWLLMAGMLSLVLGLLIWNEWPLSGLWAVGVLVGVNLLATGFSMVWLSFMLNKMVEKGM